jgi:V8-like Glu-specific endopeptidase
MTDDALERERLSLERERLRVERQKLALEFRLKRRELGERGDKSWKELLANPLMLAIAGGFLTLMTTIVTTSYSANESRKAETLRAELARESAKQALQAELIKKFVESPKTETRENLRFLVDAGLLPDYAGNITTYLDKNPQAAPAVGTGSLIPPVVGPTDQRIILSNAAVAVQAKFQGVGIIRVVTKTGEVDCSGFLAAPSIIVTLGPCLGDPSGLLSATIALQPPAGASSIRPRVLAIDFGRRVVVKGPPASGTYSIEIALAPLQDADVSGLAYHPLDSQPPKEGEQLEMGFFSMDKQSWVYSAGDNCRVKQVGTSELQHLCDTGGGSAGTPLLSSSGKVIGVHAGSGAPGKRGLRADVIRNDPGVRQAFGDLPTIGPNVSTP